MSQYEQSDTTAQELSGAALAKALLKLSDPKVLNVLYVATWVVCLPIAMIATYYGVQAGLTLTWFVATVTVLWVGLWDTIAHLKYNLALGPTLDKIAFLDKVMVNLVGTPVLIICYAYTLYMVGQDHGLFWPAIVTLAVGGFAIVPFPYPETGNYQNPHFYFHKLHMTGHAATPVLLVILAVILADAGSAAA